MSDEDDITRPRWQRLLLNRFVLVPLTLALVAGGWNLYTLRHDDGIVTGQVVDDAGAPVADATVTLWTFNFTTFAETAKVMSRRDGRFSFVGNPSHNIQVSAEKPGTGRSARVPIRLYFRSQNVGLPEPLRLRQGG
ncbi:carboxypeptidase-like regulatory domain-containing protein [Phreatobacter stygius]|uniref:Carboxypeptidase regulatory-like domain-containing protein n=1 Tax=Phreatobacter stygius TaxID=1940610 RepID=A0A4D7BCA8_9HYPH|nr:carboxypeptidase-like regulatory domain-containing protein [Phreatobacter stygius]QCI67016.1 carboxypeptidase regulatory-like domain-containing protein [Phreatobacter stygius]